MMQPSFLAFKAGQQEAKCIITIKKLQNVSAVKEKAIKK